MALRSVLLVGHGGREHALLWRLCRSPQLGPASTVFLVGSNAGMAAQAAPCALVHVEARTVDDIVRMAQEKGVQLVVVGPEAPLADGIADKLAAVGVPCFGPCAGAARLETSKAFAKAFMARHGIPTAAYATFAAQQVDAALEHIRAAYAAGRRLVVKASGLAAGKGVVLPGTAAEAEAAVRGMLVDGAFGDAGHEVVLEELLQGEEASVLAFTDGTTVVAMPAAQDHKRAFEFDRGPNTGGMGAFAPAPAVTPELAADIHARVLQRAVDGMRAEGARYVGVLYAGIMLTRDGPKVLEFNCRFGDPETQVLLPLLDSDLLHIMQQCVDGCLAPADVRFKRGLHAATVVAVSDGYPGKYATGVPITAEPATLLTHTPVRGDAADTLVFHAGTAASAAPQAAAGQVAAPSCCTAGGRVLAVTGLGPSRRAALRRAYAALERIHFDGMYYRRDIGGVFVRPRADTEPLRVGVLGSTRGTDLLALLDAVSSGRLPDARVEVVVSNKADAGILDKARAAGVPAVVVPSAGRSREDFDAEVARVLQRHSVDLVLLIGFMRVLTAGFVDRFAWRLLNVHPSLLPDFAGGMDLAVHEAVLAAGCKRTGCTVHFVEAAVDAGPILLQRACAVQGGDTPAALKERVQRLEGDALVAAVQMFTDDSPVNLLEHVRRASGRFSDVAALLPQDRLPPPVDAPPVAQPAAPLTYATAGVDIDAGDALVQRIKPLARSTARVGADAELGGFGGLFDLKALGYRDPLLVAGTDGVGTKLRVALLAGVHNTVGIDLVAMSVNDLVVQGAEPILFLDYFATGKLNVACAEQVIAGVAEGCRQAACALVGGETAEMPSMYADGDYDLAGFAVGVVERDRVLPRTQDMAAGDVILGIASSGVHSNGFSLVRKVVEQCGIDWNSPPPFPSPAGRLCDAVLTPTKIYIRGLLPSLRAEPVGRVKGLAHITGGGLPENIPRVLPPHLKAVINTKAWAIPPVFRWLHSAGGGIAPAEMARTFNLGIGMVAIVDRKYADEVAREIRSSGEQVVTIGHLAAKADPKEPAVQLVGLAAAFAQ